jgi:hypothetical protein
LRDAARSFILHLCGEAINEILKKVKLEEGGTINFEGRIVHSKEELIEAIVDDHFKKRRLGEFLKKFHEEHGSYPPLPDLSKMGRLVALDEGDEGKNG